jgi:predicted ATP-grasp superfamily ATP-dependent carboligase
LADAVADARADDALLPIVDTDPVLPGNPPGPTLNLDPTGVSESTRRRVNVLMLCDLFPLPYRVMRCCAAAGATVHVLGGSGSNGLRFSRFCHRYRRSRYEFTTPSAGMSEEINTCIGELGIDLVLAGDHGSTRTLIALAPSLSAPCFPMPSLDQFDLLNNKWSFTQFCQQLGIRCPRSELVADRVELRRRLKSCDIAMPCIAKPLDLHGTRGVVVVKKRIDLEVVDTIEYRPILVQEYIDGDDMSAAVYCDHGKIESFTAFKRKRAAYFTFQSKEIEEMATKIVSATKVTGIFCFDMRIAGNDTTYWLECNPRFFYSMFFSMLAGINFVAFGLPRPASNLCSFVPTGTNVRTVKAIAAELPRPWRLTSRDTAYIRYIWADPIPLIRESLHIDRSF